MGCHRIETDRRYAGSAGERIGHKERSAQEKVTLCHRIGAEQQRWIIWFSQGCDVIIILSSYKRKSENKDPV